MAYQSIFELLLKISADGTRELEKVQKQFGAVGKSGQDAGWTIGRAWKVAGAAIGTAAASFYAVKKAVDAAAFAEMKTNMQTAFAALRTDVLPNIAAIQAAFRGLINDDAAAKIGSQFANLGLNAEDMGRAADAAFKLAAASGGDARAATDMLTQAMGTGRATTLKQWGVMLDLDASYKEYAAKIGVTAEQLDEQTKSQIRVSETLDAVTAAFARLDTSQLQTEMQAASVAMDDMIEGAKEFAGAGVTWIVRGIDALAAAAVEIVTLGDLTEGLRRENQIRDEINRELAESAPLRAAEAQAMRDAAAAAELAAAKLRITYDAHKDLAKAFDEVTGKAPVTAAETKKLMELLYGQGLAAATTAEQVGKYREALDAAIPTLEKHAQVLGWNDEMLAVFVERHAQMSAAAADLKREMEGAQTAAVMAEVEAERSAEITRRIRAQTDTEFAAKSGGVSPRGQARPEGIAAEEAEIRRIIALAQDDLTRIVAEAELERYRILRDFNAQKINGDLLGLQMLEANAKEEAALTRYKLDVEAEAERDAARVRDELRRMDEERKAASDRADEERHQRQLERLQEFQTELASQMEALRANFDAMSMMGWEFAGQMSMALDGAEDAATAFSTAAIMGQDSYAKTIPTGIAASGRLAGAFVKDTKAQAIIRGGFETAAALSAAAYGNFLGAALHGASAAMFFAVAGKGGGKSAAAGAGTSADKGGGLATDRSALTGGTAEAPRTVVINLSGFAIGSEKQLGQHVGAAINAAAGSLVFDKRLTGVQVVGF